MKPLTRALKGSPLIAMLFAASCGVGAAPGLSNSNPSSTGSSSSAPAPATQPEANTTRNPSSTFNRPPATTSPSTSVPSSDGSDDTLQQQRQQSGEQMIQERKGQAADTN